MKTNCLLLFAGLLCLVPSVANADEVTIADWRGASVTATEGSVDSDGVKVVYHTVGEGPLVIFVHRHHRSLVRLPQPDRDARR